MPGQIMPPSASIDHATRYLTAANLDTLQAQLSAAQANGTAKEENRKAMCRIQKAGYGMGFSFSAAALRKPCCIIREWMEEHSH